MKHGKCPNGCGVFLLIYANGTCPICGSFLGKISQARDNQESKYDIDTVKACLEIIMNLNQITKDFADCSICGLCCKYEEVPLSKKDIKNITKNKNIKEEVFLKKYTERSKDNIVSNIVMNQPCSFLEDGKCSIYKFRPLTCKYYPFYTIPGSPPYIEIRGIEYCALSTHFWEAFLDFCIEFNTEFLNISKINNQKDPNTETSQDIGASITKQFPILHIIKYILWLESNSNEEFFKKIEELEKQNPNN